MRRSRTPPNLSSDGASPVIPVSRFLAGLALVIGADGSKGEAVCTVES